MIYFCCDDHRRSLVRQHPRLNGIDRLEVVDREEPVLSKRQRLLRVFFVKPPADIPPFQLLTLLQTLSPDNVNISGGERTTGIRAESVSFDPIGGWLAIWVNERGDYSTYTLCLTEPNSDRPLAGLDPQLASVDFSFKVECPSDFDCQPACACPSEAPSSPLIDYLAKDYASFRQLLLDRMTLLAPEWRERNAADLGITLVELLAYVGDYLSYRQDAIATEAYLGTARLRTSVRRHARLLDYAMHDGCNARAWIHVRLKAAAPATGIRLPRIMVTQTAGDWKPADIEPAPGNEIAVRRTRFTTRLISSPAVVAEHELPRLIEELAPKVFEPMHHATLFFDHNQFAFYAWGRDRCCLPTGATKADLRGHFPNLRPGDVLVFIERLGPRTGSEADADPTRRWAVRLTNVTAFEPKQSVGDPDIPLKDPVTEQQITQIEWAIDDQLPFPFCISAVTETVTRINDVSVALGNILLADHGLTIFDPEDLGVVPDSNPALAHIPARECDQCNPSPRNLPAPRFHPKLRKSPLTQAAVSAREIVPPGTSRRAGFDLSGAASAAFKWDMNKVLPAIRLGDDRGLLWLPKLDLLSSDSFAPEFVVEIEDDERGTVRFGDDENGLRPGAKTKFAAIYRVGNGTSGNIGHSSIAHISPSALLDGQTGQPIPLPSSDLIEGVTNPLPASGGRPPETLEQVRQYAPAAFRVNKRAVTPEDYAARAEAHSEVQRAAATLRWTGSWHTIFLTVDRIGGRPVDSAFEEALREFIEPYRMAGHDLEIDGPRCVALELHMTVCVAPDYFRSDVESALMNVFSSRRRADGTLGFFHPDNFTFGQPVYLSAIYAEAQKVAGVRHVTITVFERQGTPSRAALDSGLIEIGRLEIAQLENDANFPDRGVMRFEMKGGR